MDLPPWTSGPHTLDHRIGLKVSTLDFVARMRAATERYEHGSWDHEFCPALTTAGDVRIRCTVEDCHEAVLDLIRIPA